MGQAIRLCHPSLLSSLSPQVPIRQHRRSPQSQAEGSPLLPRLCLAPPCLAVVFPVFTHNSSAAHTFFIKSLYSDRCWSRLTARQLLSITPGAYGWRVRSWRLLYQCDSPLRFLTAPCSIAAIQSKNITRAFKPTKVNLWQACVRSWRRLIYRLFLQSSWTMQTVWPWPGRPSFW